MATEHLTYDPVVDSQPLPRVRVLSPLRPPPPGRALVLVPDAGPALTVWPGERVPDAVFGVYQGMFTVDTTEHRLVLPSNSPAATRLLLPLPDHAGLPGRRPGAGGVARRPGPG
ncbi:hypothetical protein NKH77_19225 [Streptomyces sp. M19]